MAGVVIAAGKAHPRRRRRQQAHTADAQEDMRPALGTASGSPRTPVRTRTLVVWCPDWPAAAALREAGLSAHTAAAVLVSGRVQVTTAAARALGVRVGMRQRDAQSRCPEMAVLRADPGRDARLFEPIAAAVEEIVPAIEILRPGLLACGIRGLVRYSGSEDAAAERVIDVVEAEGAECRIGIAGSLPVAVLAAHRGTIVPTAGALDDATHPDTAFCARLPIRELAADPAIAPPSWRELTHLLIRLGIVTAGELAALPLESVIGRFGADGAALHRLASGRQERDLSRRVIAEDIATEHLCDPPVERVDTAAFAARSLAERFHGRLAASGLACTRLAITATTGSGERLHRIWRVTRPLSAVDTADRLRWQLDGWLTRRAIHDDRYDDIADPDRHGITSLRLEALEAVDAGRIQYGLWGSDGSGGDRATAAFARVQGLLGTDGVITAMRSGGRGVADRIATAAWGEQIIGARDPAAPWPGALLSPAPTRAGALPGRALPGRVLPGRVLPGRVLPGQREPYTARPDPSTRRRNGHRIRTDPASGRQPVWTVGRWVDLRDSADQAVLPTDRGILTGAPARIDGRQVLGWAGPWIFDERWWSDGDAVEDAVAGGTTAPGSVVAMTATPHPAQQWTRMQIVPGSGPPVLLASTSRGWRIEAVYD